MISCLSNETYRFLYKLELNFSFLLIHNLRYEAFGREIGFTDHETNGSNGEQFSDCPKLSEGRIVDQNIFLHGLQSVRLRDFSPFLFQRDSALDAENVFSSDHDRTVEKDLSRTNVHAPTIFIPE